MIPGTARSISEIPVKEVIPRVSRVAVLWNSANPGVPPEWRETEAAARVLRVELQSVEVKGSRDFISAFSLIARERPGALIVEGGSCRTRREGAKSWLGGLPAGSMS